MSDDYKATIVDPGDRASKLAYEICAESYGNCPALVVVPHDPGNFRGGVGITWREHILREMAKTKFSPDGRSVTEWTMIQGVENDGAGRKPGFATLGGTPELFGGLGWEVITMCADDLARTGRLPTFMANQVDVAGVTEQNFHLIEALFRGYGDALKKARLANITGEFAVMPGAITAFCYAGEKKKLALTWSGCCYGLTHRELLICRRDITSQMWIVGLGENGYRCNGGGFLIKLVDWATLLRGRDFMKSFVERLCTSSVSYANFISRMVGWNPDGSIREEKDRIKFAGIAHITGGGVWGKFGEMLPLGVAAVLDNMPIPPSVLLDAQRISKDTGNPLSDYDAYGTLHGGCGMLLVCRTRDDADRVVEEAQKEEISASVVGKTVPHTAGVKKLTIHSRFSEYDELLESKD